MKGGGGVEHTGEYMPAGGIDSEYTGQGEFMPVDGMNTQHTDIGEYIPVEGVNTQHTGGGDYLSQLANLIVPVSFLVAQHFLKRKDKNKAAINQKGGDIQGMLTSLGSRIEGILNESNYLKTG